LELLDIAGQKTLGLRMGKLLDLHRIWQPGVYALCKEDASKQGWLVLFLGSSVYILICTACCLRVSQTCLMLAKSRGRLEIVKFSPEEAVIIFQILDPSMRTYHPSIISTFK
jgi:hypothetical protein